jgi:hypothetical protein
MELAAAAKRDPVAYRLALLDKSSRANVVVGEQVQGVRPITATCPRWQQMPERLFRLTAETMIPEAFHNGPRYSGVLAAAGFAAIILLGELAK